VHRVRSGQVRIIEAILSLIVILSGTAVAQQLISYKIAANEQRPFELEEVANKIASAMKSENLHSKICGEETDGLLRDVIALVPDGYAVNITIFFTPEFQLEQYRDDFDDMILLGFRKTIVWGAYDWSRSYSTVFQVSCSQPNMSGKVLGFGFDEIGSFRDRISLQVIVGVSAG